MDILNEKEIRCIKQVFEKLSGSNPNNETIKNIYDKFKTHIPNYNKNKEIELVVQKLVDVGIVKDIKNMTRSELAHVKVLLDNLDKVIIEKDIFYNNYKTQSFSNKEEFENYLYHYDSLLINTIKEYKKNASK